MLNLIKFRSFAHENNIYYVIPFQLRLPALHQGHSLFLLTHSKEKPILVTGDKFTSETNSSHLYNYNMNNRTRSLIVLVVAIIINCSKIISGQGLEFKLAGARLPKTLRESSAVYDGVDHVYIFGG
jgi:hypothetical protein